MHELEFQQQMNNLVDCVGCKDSLQKFLSVLSIQASQESSSSVSLDDLQITATREIGMAEHLLSSNWKIAWFLQVFLNKSDALETLNQQFNLFKKQIGGQKNYRCNLHSQKPIASLWKDNFEQIFVQESDCQLEEFIEIEECTFLSNLDKYLKKRKFCMTCKENILGEYTKLKENVKMNSSQNIKESDILADDQSIEYEYHQTLDQNQVLQSQQQEQQYLQQHQKQKQQQQYQQPQQKQQTSSQYSQSEKERMLHHLQESTAEDGFEEEEEEGAETVEFIDANLLLTKRQMHQLEMLQESTNFNTRIEQVLQPFPAEPIKERFDGNEEFEEKEPAQIVRTHDGSEAILNLEHDVNGNDNDDDLYEDDDDEEEEEIEEIVIGQDGKAVNSSHLREIAKARSAIRQHNSHHHHHHHSNGQQEDEEDDDEEIYDDDDDDDEEEDETSEDCCDGSSQYDIMNCIKYCHKEAKISIPMQLEYVQEILTKAAIDTSLVKHASTIEAAQDELLICLGQTLKEKLQVIWKNRKSEEIVRSLFLNICFRIFVAQLQGAIKDAMQRAGKKSDLEMYLESQEFADKAKKDQKKSTANSQKKSKKKKGKNVGGHNTSAPSVGETQNQNQKPQQIVISAATSPQQQQQQQQPSKKTTVLPQNTTSGSTNNIKDPAGVLEQKPKQMLTNYDGQKGNTSEKCGEQNQQHSCEDEMEPFSESEIEFLIRIGWIEEYDAAAGGGEHSCAITQADIDEHIKNTAKRESMIAALRKKLKDNFQAMLLQAKPNSQNQSQQKQCIQQQQKPNKSTKRRH